MSFLKKIAKIKSNDTEPSKNGSPDEKKKILLTYFQDGYGTSKNSAGNVTVLKVCFDNIYEDFKKKCTEDQVEQDKFKAPIQKLLNRARAEKEKLTAHCDIKNGEISHKEQEVEKIDHEIVDVKIDPEKYGIDADKRPRVQYYIGLLLLIPITIYLLVFYISASYSAFFKEFDTDELSAAIFDANALSTAYQDGLLEAIFVCTIPFVFMGLGYLIHMFMREGAAGRWKIALLIVTTFVYDAILAYQIEKKIYDLEKTLASPPFDMVIAFQSVEFWGIIFAGFITYIIWGFVLDFVIKEHENVDKVKAYIRTLKEKKKVLLDQVTGIRETLVSIKEKISELEESIRTYEHDLANTVFFPKKDYLLFHHEYLKGWMVAITKELMMPKKDADQLLGMCREVSEEHLTIIGIDITSVSESGINETAVG